MNAATIRAWLDRKPPGSPYTMRRILSIYSGLMLAVLIASLDQTIVATALPEIVSDLGGLHSYSWVFTSFLLCQAISVPIFGKLGDIYGRRPLLVTAIAIFVASSACCGAAPNMTDLVIFRGIQGIGAGGLIPLANAAVGELVPPRERGRYAALISVGFAASAVLGPSAGGLIVDHASWRWIFYVNLPLGGIALLVIALTMPKRTWRREHSIDYAGAALFTGAASSFLLALVWGGETYPWASPEILGLAAACAVCGIACVHVERRASEPIIPPRLLREPMVRIGALNTALISTCTFGTIAFVPLYAQGVLGTSATSSGVVLTPYMLGGVAGAIVSGQWMARRGRYRNIGLLGAVLLVAGTALHWRMSVSTSTGEVARNMALQGLGMGLAMGVIQVAVQNVVPERVVGATTALIGFSRAIGTTVGVTLYGVIVAHGLPSHVSAAGAAAHHLGPAARR